MRIGVNLLWLKPKAMGGVETFVKNLLRGFCEVDSQSEYVLFINGSAWQYLVSELNLPENFISVIKDWDPFNVSGMVVKQFIKINKLVAKYKVDVLYHPTPIYPIRKMKGIPQIVTFHDLLFLHYPEYASFSQRLKYLWTWKACLKNADKIVAISEFTKNDIIKNFDIDERKIEVIYNPVVLPEKSADFDELATRYDLTRKQYFYTISSLLPHKNTEVLILLMHLIVKEKVDRIPDKLVISGVGKYKGTRLEQLVKELGVQNNVIFTGFVTEEEKRTLYENCYAFLFPSLFEGFGMPPVEALMLGVPVVTTAVNAIMETTQNLVSYVSNPSDEKEWLQKILMLDSISSNPSLDFREYDKKMVSKRYLEVFYQTFQNDRLIK
jgi:glycosyltransferase involved in cell wall biosynthesis